MSVDLHREADASVLKEGIFFFAKLNRKLAILTTGLIVITVGPQNADAAEVLFQVGRRAHVGSGKEAEAAGVNFETLIDRKFTGEVDRTFRILWVDLIVVGKWLGQKGRRHVVEYFLCGVLVNVRDAWAVGLNLIDAKLLKATAGADMS